MFRRLQAEVTHLGNLLGHFHNHSHSVECLTNTHLDGQPLGRLRFVCKNKKKTKKNNQFTTTAAVGNIAFYIGAESKSKSLTSSRRHAAAAATMSHSVSQCLSGMLSKASLYRHHGNPPPTTTTTTSLIITHEHDRSLCQRNPPHPPTPLPGQRPWLDHWRCFHMYKRTVCVIIGWDLLKNMIKVK